MLNKPWITKGILTSIKKRHKLFKSHFLSSDPEKIQEYKSYSKGLNKIKTNGKHAYFNTQFTLTLFRLGDWRGAFDARANFE